jgi:uncharacterized protein (TIGR02246 family)
MDAAMSAWDVAAELAASFSSAWNRHDMDALAGLFHEDAGFVNVRGSYMQGAEEIRRQHAAIHAGPYKHSVLRAEVVDARELASGAIVAHVGTELEGDERAPGQTRHALATFVIQRRGRLWRFAAAHNTEVQPLPR